MDTASLRYAKTHEWVALDGDTATIGITDFAVQALTDLVYLELPAAGSSVAAGAVFGVVESVKAASDLYAPVSGEVTDVNESLPDDLGILSDDPYDKGWMVRVRISDPSQVEALLDKAAYDAFCESEG